MKALEDSKRAAVIEALSKDELKFNDLLRKLDLRSNELSYHPKILLGEGYLHKEASERYCLTDKGKVMVPYLKFIRREEIPPTIFCAPVVVHDGRAVFIRRSKEPYKGFLEFAGGKVRKGETLLQAAIRELEEETGILAENGRILCFADILTSKGHHFLGVYVRLDLVSHDGKGENEPVWVDVAKVKDQQDMLDDNRLIVSRFLDATTQYITILYDDEENVARILDTTEK